METRLSVQPEAGNEGNLLIVIFLRGAADGLALVAPTGDAKYRELRPGLAFSASDGVPLDGFYTLNTRLRPLEALWESGELCIVHGVGSESDTRSHFQAQDWMEHGGLAGGGWLGRYLRAITKLRQPGALDAVAIAPTLPEVLAGAPSATAVEALSEFVMSGSDVPFTNSLERLYGSLPDSPLRKAAATTFEAMKRIAALQGNTQPENGAEYLADGFSQSLRQIARLAKGGVGLQAATVDLGGWDSHLLQNTLIDPLMERLARGLAAFRTDIGRHWTRTTVLVMTEFGRRVAENSAYGTDHGRGSVMFVAGGAVDGRRVAGVWRGLDALVDPGDLPVWNNYRDVVLPVLAWHSRPWGGALAPAEIFPDWQVTPIPVMRGG